MMSDERSFPPRSSSFIILVLRRIRNPRLCEPPFANQTRVTPPTGPPRSIGVVAGVGQRVVDAERGAAANDVSLGHADERRHDARFTAFVSAARPSHDHLLKG